MDSRRSALRAWRGPAPSVLIILVGAFALIGLAVAGTETGEFCPTCPDWTNMDGWYKQKEAYVQSELDRHTSQPASPVVTATGVAPAVLKEYTKPGLLTDAGKGLEGLVILDVRAPGEYAAGHVPASRNIYWKDTVSGEGLDPVKMEAALERAGINSSDRVALVGGSDDYGAAYAFWAIGYMGQENLSIVDGGVDAVLAAGIPLVTNAPQPAASNYTSSKAPWLLVNETSLAAVMGGEGIQVLDARDWTEYGRSKLVGAISIEAANLYDGSKIKDAKALEELFDRRSIDSNQTQLVYGTPDAYPLFYALRLMGYKVTLIDGDWWKETEWATGSVS